jgi:hypothetical protein
MGINFTKVCDSNMKIFGIGLSRTGTKSLAMALNMLGLSVTEKYNAVVDMVPPVIFSGIYAKYPDAMYMLTARGS